MFCLEGRDAELIFLFLLILIFHLFTFSLQIVNPVTQPRPYQGDSRRQGRDSRGGRSRGRSRGRGRGRGSARGGDRNKQEERKSTMFEIVVLCCVVFGFLFFSPFPFPHFYSS